MKKLFAIIILSFPVITFGQNVAINNDASVADNSALLDIKSTTKGLLTPRMTSAQRIAIVSPAVGLMVFDINTFSFWIFRGALNNGWVEMVHSQQNYWTQTGTDIYNNNLGNVGIGTNTPGSKLTINGADPVIGLLNNGLATGFIQANGFDMKIGTHPDNPVGGIVFQPKGIDRVWVDENGQVGIGTGTPSSLLTVNGTNPLFQMRHSNSNKGFLQALGNDLKLGTNSTNTLGNLVFQTKQLDRMMIDENGQVGIGTIAPVSALTINGTNPYIEMQHGNINTGFLQASGINLKLGTNSTNTNGNLVLQTKLVDRMTIDNNGLVGIGTSSPSSLLTLNGTDPILQIRNANIDKGFIQLSGDNIKIGTNASNNTGKFIVRTNGSDRVIVDEDGRVAINNPNTFGSNALTVGNANGPASIGFSNSNQSFGYLNFSLNSATIQANNEMSIHTAGNGIKFHSSGELSMGGNTKANNYFLSVHGRFIATQVTEQAVNNWPDYVFEKDYKLKTLSEVKQFIAENKHLPNIPSAAEIEKTGVSLGDMSKRLMEKIEELTLYILQQQEQIDELKKKIK
ncbi:MAG: hypothetical protein WBP16_09395 [Ferruginibacter sp.]